MEVQLEYNKGTTTRILRSTRVQRKNYNQSMANVLQSTEKVPRPVNSKRIANEWQPQENKNNQSTVQQAQLEYSKRTTRRVQ